MDVLGWHDSDGDDCAWHAGSGDNNECEEWGSCCENDGHTANTACCVCGGGIGGLKSSPSSAPSSIPSQSPSLSQQPSTTPSQQPSLSFQPTTLLYQMQRDSALGTLYDATNG